jgi:hypothetical protein
VGSEVTGAFALTEDELSNDARAILAYARRWGEPFARPEITDVAPGAAWDPMSRYPRTIAKVDPIRELVRTGLIELAEERRSRSNGARGGNTYKVYRLVDSPRSLAELLDAFALEASETIRAEILERFGPRR